MNRRWEDPTLMLATNVATALQGAGIRAILTGGACAGIYTGGRYTSSDLDFVLSEPGERQVLDRALDPLGFRQDGDHYGSPASPFILEFLPGPVAIGADTRIRPALVRWSGGTLRMLSATDSCRDRLAAWHHWKDPQSLDVAILIALNQRLNWGRIASWSAAEGFADRCAEFRAAVKSRRAVGRGKTVA